MSDQPPPPPYGEGPGQGDGRPPSGPPPHPGPPYRPPETSNTARFWVGVALALPALVVVVVLYGGVGAVMGADSSGVSGVLPLLLTLLLVVGFVWAIVHDRTRFVALGILAGFAIVFVLLAGACVVLVSSAGGFS